MKNKTDQIIPIFFSTDDNYIPFLDVAISSLIQNASKEFKYKIIVLHTGLKEENAYKIKAHINENFDIELSNIESAVEELSKKLPNLYHFGLATYYRIFIQSLFPEYNKILYLDCDVVVLGDISKLFFIDMKDNLVAGVVEQFILRTPEFSNYTKEAIGIEAKNYINAGVMIMNLKEFRKYKLEEKFIYLVNKYNFDVIDPDQAYINFLCQGRIRYIDVAWNRTPIYNLECENPQIIHYALYRKPWQYDDVYLGEYFWQYAKESQFYDKILNIKNSFDEAEKAQKEKASMEIKEHALRVVNSGNNFVTVFGSGRNINIFDNYFFNEKI